jgi:tripartite-type tricarboxylate transporter receptor subunit TctC
MSTDMAARTGWNRRQWLASLLALGVARYAGATEPAYPSKPIRFIAPFPPGGGADALTRLIAQKLSMGLSQPVIVENRDGAGGSIGAEIVAKSAPDGYTIMMGASATMAVNPHLYQHLPYDTLRAFTPVTLLARIPIVLFVNKSLPVHSVRDLIDYAKKNPGKLNFGSAGNGSVGHMAGEILKSMTGIDMVHVPFKGSAPAMTSLIGGQVQLMFDSPLSGMQHARAGQITALAVCSLKRSSVLPELPTIAETGVPGFEAVLWYGLYVPAATPRPVIDILNRELQKDLQLPEVKRGLVNQSLEGVGGTPEQADAFWRAEYARWGTVIKSINVHLD